MTDVITSTMDVNLDIKLHEILVGEEDDFMVGIPKVRMWNFFLTHCFGWLWLAWKLIFLIFQRKELAWALTCWTDVYADEWQILLTKKHRHIDSQE